MSKFIRLPRLVAATAAVLFILVLGIGNAFAQVDIIPVDIKPGSCPNPVNVKSNGVLPVAIFGMGTFDVNDVDPSNILLEGMSPLRTALEDVVMAFDCNDPDGDGLLDLTLKFDTQEVVAVLGEVADGVPIMLSLTETLPDGTEIGVGGDMVLILKKGNGGNSALAPGRNK